MHENIKNIKTKLIGSTLIEIPFYIFLLKIIKSKDHEMENEFDFIEILREDTYWYIKLFKCEVWKWYFHRAAGAGLLLLLSIFYIGRSLDHSSRAHFSKYK